MKIEIKKGELPIKIKRLVKLNRLENIKNDAISYNWKITPENENENIQDFHLFCISIVKDIIKNRFKTNEKGIITYKSIEFHKNTYEDLQKLFTVICDENRRR